MVQTGEGNMGLNEFQHDILALLRSAFDGTPVTLSAAFDWQEALAFGRRQSLLPLLYAGAQNADRPLPTALAATVEQKLLQNLVADSRQQAALTALYAAFEQNGIDYMPLKGAGLKALYPASELRPMGDADILIRCTQYEKIGPVMQALGYTAETESDHELVWISDAVKIELHKKLLPRYNRDYYAYYGDGWRLAVPVQPGGFRYAMRPEDELVYLITHLAKHYRNGGIGLRHLLDIHVFCAANKALRFGYVGEQLSRLELMPFGQHVIRTANTVFTGGTPDAAGERLLAFMFSGGAFGTYERRAVFEAVRKSNTVGGIKKSRRHIFLFHAFPPMDVMEKMYPCLAGKGFLLPAFWVVRAFDLLLRRRDRIYRQKEEMRLITDERVAAYHREMSAVGLGFNFKETK